MSARKPFVAAISGIKNSGKTTFLEHLVPVLRARGLRVAVIKHDGHDFTPDVPGTDSFRMRQAGADGVAVYSGHQWMVVRPQPGSLEALIGLFADCDLVLLEGQKASPYPKIELVRGAVSQESVCAPETLLALATDTPARVDGVETIGLEDYARAAGILLHAMRRWPIRKKKSPFAAVKLQRGISACVWEIAVRAAAARPASGQCRP